ncbi:hypothetical protein ACHHYP_06023 [Achlya hypogyna]|uniref:RRM domain-containing protein n=1 Tax=Achlya hypogyna TaxID=1202772 RepID=A0A1V9YVG5_ACHHY|nr:hypothetical protein ACHHYP_06023 [Achlya hypogyna]
MGLKIFIRHVPDGVDDAALEKIFEGYGVILSIHLRSVKAPHKPLVRHGFIVRSSSVMKTQ